MIKPGPQFRFGLLIGAILMVADQISKYWVLHGLQLPARGSVELLPFLNFTMVWNYGISMGLPIGQTLGKWGIIVLTIAISLWLARWLAQSTRRFEALSIAMILGGAVGNVIDRFVHGAVVDFVHLHAAGYSFYVFNLADSAITVGVALLIIDGLRAGNKGPKNAPKVGERATDPEGESS
ncbi:MAG: signal peptidase II [Alphaproteobacteria bacterium]|nr:MAG: signal peptidase II [Alphaproteobacteria bacterium]